MVGLGPHKQESTGSQQQDDFLNLERKRYREGSVHITHTSRSHSRVGSYVSQEQHNRAMQLEIEQLKRKLHHARQERTPPPPILTFPLKVKGMLVIGEGQELHPSQT